MDRQSIRLVLLVLLSSSSFQHLVVVGTSIITFCTASLRRRNNFDSVLDLTCGITRLLEPTRPSAGVLEQDSSSGPTFVGNYQPPRPRPFWRKKTKKKTKKKKCDWVMVRRYDVVCAPSTRWSPCPTLFWRVARDNEKCREFSSPPLITNHGFSSSLSLFFLHKPLVDGRRDTVMMNNPEIRIIDFFLPPDRFTH
jgi:hypothetical protein